jgi:hypothetical protein
MFGVDGLFWPIKFDIDLIFGVKSKAYNHNIFRQGLWSTEAIAYFKKFSGV